MPFWLIIILHFTRPKNQKPFAQINGVKYSFTILIALVFISFLKSFMSGFMPLTEMIILTMEWSTIFTFGYIVFAKADHKTRKLNYHAIFYSLGLFILINILLYLLGVRSEQRLLNSYSSGYTIATLLSYFGIETYRVLFPLANGINSFGNLAGASLALWLILFENKTLKIQAIIYSVASLLVILMVDSRGAFFYCLLAVGLIKIVPVKKINYAIIPVIIMCVIYFIGLLNLDTAMSATSGINFSFLATFARNTTDLELFGGRYLIWKNAINELTHFSLSHLLGFGAYGQTISGISGNYYNIAKNFASPERLSLHSTLFQYIFDIGYVGLASYIVLIISLFKALINKAGKYEKAILGLLFYMLIASLFEVNLTIYFKENFSIFTFLVFSLMYREKLEEQQLN